MIVGGSGFIGRHLVNAAIRHNYQPTIISLHQVDPSARIAGVDYLNADISRLSELTNTLSEHKFTHVVNLGGYVDHSGYQKGGREVVDAHFGGVRNLLYCLDWGILESFVQIGSSDEYGNAASPISESVREAPISPYSFSKVAAGQLLQMLHRTEGFPAVILRLFLVYGPGQNMRRFLPQVIDGCLRGDSFATSLGEQTRDFCYIDDIVDGILAALAAPGAHGEIVNLASGDPVTIRSIVEKTVAAVGSGAPQYGEIPYRNGESMALYADTSKAKKILGWKPKITLDDGLARTISYYENKS